MEYYEAYDKRYKQVHSKNTLWSTTENTKEIVDAINKYNISKNDRILDLGCGEGRDAIYLLNNGYNVLGIDYSKEAIDTCNKLTGNKYKNNFKQFDFIKDKPNNKFNFIYSIAVLHMFVNDGHRNEFYNFVYDSLNNNGYAFIVIMGDGTKNYKSDITQAFKNNKRTNMVNGKSMLIASTSCKIVDWNNLEQEIKRNKLKIIDQWISKNILEFDSCMCTILKRQ